ncbi:30S ribosomal protein S1, chloroplastic [Coccomyxa sp. Obi]|nr:30S ribosomal protein S1, chloroplastic [Coccomyxa sp. Obi]
MTSVSTFLPQNKLLRIAVAKSLPSSSNTILLTAQGKIQLHSAGSNKSTARAVRSKLHIGRAAVTCVAQVEEIAHDAPSQSLNGAGLDLDRPVPVERVRQDEAEDASPSSAHAATDYGSRDSESYRRDNNRSRGRDNKARRGGRSGEGREPRESRAPRYNDPRRSPCTDHTLKVGDVVLGRVIRSQGKGSNVELVDDPRIVGFSLAQDGPYLMRDRVGYDQTNMLLPVGLVRQFLVKAIPEEMEYYGKGPLLSAKELDIELAWERARQMQRVCQEDKENFTVTVTDVNSGGLLATLESLPAFVPYSLMDKSQDSSWMSIEDVREKYHGKAIEVGIKDVAPQMRKVVLSMQQATNNKLIRQLTVGALVWGTVRRVEQYGVFVGIENTRFSGLLHISSISQAHIESVEDVFRIGDRVRAILIGMDEGFQRISLSTAELEATPGDMLYSKEKVFEEAEVQAAAALKRLQQREEDERFYGNDKPQRQGGDSFDFNGDYRA